MCASIAPHVDEAQCDTFSEHLLPVVNERIGGWYNEWYDQVRYWLSRRSKVPAAELDDLTQEVFLRLLRYSQDTHITNPLGYLLRTASNVASEWRERARVAKPHASEWLEELLIDEMLEPENFVDRDLHDARLTKALASLPPRQRQVLLLAVEEDLNCPQIAQELCITQRIVYRDRYRAYNAVRNSLQAASA